MLCEPPELERKRGRSSHPRLAPSCPRWLGPGHWLIHPLGKHRALHTLSQDLLLAWYRCH